MKTKLVFILLLNLFHGCGNRCTTPVMVNVTSCCDGTRANCTGRGCCSYHGGLCTYQRIEYREIQCPQTDGGTE